ncbi:DUF805 domain-containing protein [Fulvivirgaceae bacterium BMA10]|uniref:DUF805 domain-containing protein n=1 Tax=Splendidivirga corallicola TaxID=3051826 RepID=A0ABT8L1F9_9BACT|nr:DUF805 domain-containing protein [Fulvivirgaceae bacterium BMA10]
MNWYLAVMKNYAGFTGRARRTEYWMFVLFNVIFTITALILDNVLGINMRGTPYGPLYFLYALITFLPALAVAVRRLHDIDRSGWFVLISIIPIIGSIILLIFLCTEGNKGDNPYGPDPKNEALTDVAGTESNSDALILIVVIWMFFSRTFWFLGPKLSNDFFSTPGFEAFSKFSGLIWAFIPLALAFSVKDKSKRIALFILGGLYMIEGLYETITRIL